MLLDFREYKNISVMRDIYEKGENRTFFGLWKYPIGNRHTKWWSEMRQDNTRINIII